MFPDSDLSVVQKDEIQKRLIKMVAVFGVCLGIVTAALHIQAGDWKFVLAWSLVAAFNVCALCTVSWRLDVAAKLFIASLLIPALGINFSNLGSGAGVYLAIPGLITCAWATTSTRFSFWFALILTVVMLITLSASQIVAYEEFSKTYQMLERSYYLNMSMCLILSVFIVSGAVYSLKRTYVETQKELVEEKNSANLLRQEIADSFSQKSALLEMALHMQEMGKVYGLVYYVENDALCHPRKGQGDYVIGTLEEANAKSLKNYDSDWAIIPLIRQALEDGKNWDSEYQMTDRAGKTSYLRTRGEVVEREGAIEKIIIVINDITETSILNRQLSMKANTDDLTGILSRRRFEEIFENQFRLARELGRESMYLFIDLDRFKIVNDTSGHAAGDSLLKEVCKILSESVRENDKVGRLGGDEFGIILHNCRYEKASEIAEIIRSRIEAYRFSWSDLQHRIEACIGVVAIDPALGSPAEIQALADAACYRAKNKGRNRVESVIDDENNYRNENTEKMRVNQIDEALDNGLISLWFQEIVCAQKDSGLITRREILIRLYDPKNDSWVMPVEFLSVAERFNRSAAIDKWVVSELISLLESSEEPEKYEYWVNLSAQSISDPRFSKHLHELLTKTSLPPGTINFEITETSAIINVSSAINMMNQLRQFGCKFALDDFGVGHASFGSLRTLPVDSVKIDGIFIRNIVNDPVDRIFARSIIEISHAFEMSVTAEYVEDEETVSLLSEMGVDYLQGYHFSRPEPLEPDLDLKTQATG